MILISEPKTTFIRVKIYVVKVDDELSDHGLMPGMVFEAWEELSDGLSVERYWINETVHLSPPFCRKL